MARHSLFPGFIKIGYTSNGHPHVQILPVNADPTAVGASYTIPTRAGTPVDWQTAAAAWAELLAATLDATASIDTATLYNFEADPAPADFLQEITLGVPGASGGPLSPFGQIVFPFKGVGGLSLRPYIMEATYTVDVKTPVADLDGASGAIVAFVLGSSDWIALRGGGFPTVSLGTVTKTNDVLRKRYFNP